MEYRIEKRRQDKRNGEPTVFGIHLHGNRVGCVWFPVSGDWNWALHYGDGQGPCAQGVEETLDAAKAAVEANQHKLPEKWRNAA